MYFNVNHNEVHHRQTLARLAVWMTLVLYWPTLQLGSFQFRLDYPLMLVLLLWVMLGKRSIHGSRILAFIFLYVCSLLVGSINGVTNGYDFLPQVFLGAIKPFLLMFLWIQILHRVPPAEVCRLTVLLLVPAAALSILQISVPELVSGITVDWYSSDSRTSAEALYGASPIASRAVSVFETPVYAAVSFLFAFLLTEIAFQQGMFLRITTRVLQVLFVIAGTATATATFFLGFVIILSLILVREIRRGAVSSVVRQILFSLLILSLLVVAVELSGNDLFSRQILYQAQKIITGSLFDSRFGVDGQQGLLTSTLANIGEYLWVGVGATAAPYFIGDNLYLSVLTRNGLVGLLFVMISVGAIWIKISRMGGKRHTYRACLLVLLAVGLGSATLWIPRFSEVLMLVLAIPMLGFSERTRVEIRVGSSEE